MAIVSVRIPQIGEGLQEARLVAVLKQPGERVKRDEPIYQMETDKAVMDVESPYEGILTEWLAEADAILAIGAEVARMEVAGEVSDAEPTADVAPEVEVAAAPAATEGRGLSNLNVPPRTRAYAKEKGLSEEQIAAIPAAGSKLMPSDVDAFLGGSATLPYVESAVPSKQRVLNSRMVRGNALVVPGTISVAVNWEPIDRARAAVKASGDSFQPSAFTMLAYAVAATLRDYPAFRTSIVGDETFRTYHHASLGIAVSLPGDELVLAVVEEADALDWRAFAERTRDRIELARTGKDQANESVTVSLTNMQNFGLRDAIPVVVPPSVGTLFVGEIYGALDPSSETPRVRRTANLALTFDHRVVNGVGAAQFLNAVKKKLEAIDEVLAG